MLCYDLLHSMASKSWFFLSVKKTENTNKINKNNQKYLKEVLWLCTITSLYHFVILSLLFCSHSLVLITLCIANTKNTDVTLACNCLFISKSQCLRIPYLLMTAHNSNTYLKTCLLANTAAVRWDICVSVCFHGRHLGSAVNANLLLTHHISKTRNSAGGERSVVSLHQAAGEIFHTHTLWPAQAHTLTLCVYVCVWSDEGNICWLMIVTTGRSWSSHH